MLTDVGKKKEARKKRHRSIRKRMEGTPERPRLAVFRSARHIYVQVIDDIQQKTLVGATDLQIGKSAAKDDAPAPAPEGKGAGKAAGKPVGKKDRAKQVGALIAQKCLEKGIDKVVFDRAGYKYHGRISALAAGAREAGLKF